jgi:hypothetical protein
MSKITIPPEALEAALMERYSKIWHDLSEGQKENLRLIERAACLAMLSAWPGMEFEPPYKILAIILPLTQAD